MNNCKFCQKEIEKEYNFCPYCGNALNDNAKTIENQKNQLSNLKLVSFIVDRVEDKKTLELLKKIADNLKEA